MYARVDITDAAREVVDRLRDKHGPLMFHQSGGCCDGSSPMCFEDGDFKVGASDVLLGEIHGCGFYMSKSQFEHWQDTHLTIDVTPGRGASFSLEIPLGVRFVTKSRLFSEEEQSDLVPVVPGS
jgi:uncharacterized protein (DUF779 family)